MEFEVLYECLADELKIGELSINILKIPRQLFHKNYFNLSSNGSQWNIKLLEFLGDYYLRVLLEQNEEETPITNA